MNERFQLSHGSHEGEKEDCWHHFCFIYNRQVIAGQIVSDFQASK